MYVMMKMHLVQEVKYFYPTNQTERLQCTDNNYEQTTLTWKCIFLVLYCIRTRVYMLYFLAIYIYTRIYAWKTIRSLQCMHICTKLRRKSTPFPMYCMRKCEPNIPLSFFNTLIHATVRIVKVHETIIIESL